MRCPYSFSRKQSSEAGKVSKNVCQSHVFAEGVYALRSLAELGMRVFVSLTGLVESCAY